MIPGNQWKSFSRNSENKQALIDLFTKHLARRYFPQEIKITKDVLQMIQRRVDR